MTDLLKIFTSAAVACFLVLGTYNLRVSTVRINSFEEKTPKLNTKPLRKAIHSTFIVETRNIGALVEDNCLCVGSLSCSLLKDALKTNFSAWIHKNNMSECAILNQVKNNCLMTTDTCSIVEMYPNEAHKFKSDFWFQDVFNITQKNIDQLRIASEISRFICIKQDGEGGIEENGICLRTLSLVNDVPRKARNYDFVIRYLAQNLLNYTSLNFQVAQKINYNDLTFGTAVYSGHGFKLNYPSLQHIHCLLHSN